MQLSLEPVQEPAPQVCLVASAVWKSDVPTTLCLAQASECRQRPLQLLCSCEGMQARTLRAGKFDAACTEQVYTSGQLWQMLAVPSPWPSQLFKPAA